MLLRLIANAILFEVGWTACVLSGRAGQPWLAAAAVGLLLVLHLLWTTPYGRRAREIATIAAIAALGTMVDTVNLRMGVLGYGGSHAVSPLFVVWIASFWVNFALLPNASLRWLKRRPWLAALLGAVLAPPSYLAGAKLGAIELNENVWVSMGVLAAQWALITPIVMWIARTIEARRDPPAGGEDRASASAADRAATPHDGTATGGTQAS